MKCQKVGHWTHNLQIGPNNLFYFTNLANNFPTFGACENGVDKGVFKDGISANSFS